MTKPTALKKKTTTKAINDCCKEKAAYVVTDMMTITTYSLTLPFYERSFWPDEVRESSNDHFFKERPTQKQLRSYFANVAKRHKRPEYDVEISWLAPQKLSKTA